ncbi:DUF1361 domain-containing protein [Pseudanabaena biceps]|nr:DUF1361 domain-containing protein [Pseudanabaena biceps]NUN67687.1 DUF1361 domain-containing protein [Pseudanabaena biceps]NUN67704.1 DUF1361 domain-containing protein [Pseudanabaena biceps]
MTEAFTQFLGNFRWMGWNLFLAIIPLVLSYILFTNRASKRLSKNPVWWLGLGLFILFLPNAPYIITDIIHFVDDSRSLDISSNGIIFVLIPQYMAFLLIGFQCYVVSMINLVNYLTKIKLIKNPLWTEITITFICAIAVYWGRVNRLNSWDVFTQPRFVIKEAISNLESHNFFFGTVLFFIVFSILYFFFKWLNIAIAFYWQNRPKQISA